MLSGRRVATIVHMLSCVDTRSSHDPVPKYNRAKEEWVFAARIGERIARPMSIVLPEDLIAQIHAARVRCALAITGGGSRLIGDLLQVPGGSRSVLEAVVPYADAALSSYLRSRPDQFCAPRTARAMAMVAYQRALGIEAENARLLGLGLTASLVSDRPKRGPHRVHAALQTVERTVTHSLELAKGTRERAGEELLAARIGLNLLAEGCGMSQRVALALHPGERLTVASCDASPAWRDLFTGRVDAVLQHQRMSTIVAPAAHAVIFPGAFNPLHAAHRRMAEIGQQRLGRPVEFEVSIFNVDKPPLDFIELRERAAQFARDEKLWYTRAPRFLDKIRLFPQATFLVGVDTIARIGNVAYYADDARQRDDAIEQMHAQGTRFLVFGRLCGKQFRTLDELSEVPASLCALCESVSEEAFRQDVSSTELRHSSREES